eukprot:4784371-Prymnesium_polylepis.1
MRPKRYAVLWADACACSHHVSTLDVRLGLGSLPLQKEAVRGHEAAAHGHVVVKVRLTAALLRYALQMLDARVDRAHAGDSERRAVLRQAVLVSCKVPG